MYLLAKKAAFGRNFCSLRLLSGQVFYPFLRFFYIFLIRNQNSGKMSTPVNQLGSSFHLIGQMISFWISSSSGFSGSGFSRSGTGIPEKCLGKHDPGTKPDPTKCHMLNDFSKFPDLPNPEIRFFITLLISRL